MDKTAIVILNWNGVNMLTRFLPNVLDYSRDEAVVYVADNASTDNSVEILKRHFPEVRLIIFDRNWGFAEGYNKALEQIEAEYYVLLNSDVEVSHHWYQKKIVIHLSIRELVAVILTFMVILSAVAEFLML